MGFFFFFQAEDGIRDYKVTGVQTCALPIWRRLADLADARRYEDAARLRDRLQALERVCRELERAARLRAVERCIVVPGAEPGHARAFFIAGGRIAAERTLPP